MTKQMCIDAKGNPQKINKTTTIYGTSEQWVYYGLYLYFENGILTTIQDWLEDVLKSTKHVQHSRW